MAGNNGAGPDKARGRQFRRIWAQIKSIRLPKIRFYWTKIAGPRTLLREIIARYSQNRVSRELRQFINLYLAKSLLQRLLILSLVALFYILARELHGDVNLYVAIITLLVALYTICCVVVGACLYLVFSIQHGLVLSPMKAIYLYTAQEIKKTILNNHWSVRLLLRMVVGKPEEFAHDIAHGTIYSEDISRLIAGRLVYYGLIIGAYMLGYRLLYEKLVSIDFSNFFHPFIWAWLYLTARVYS